MATLIEDKTSGLITLSGEFSFNTTLSLFKQSQSLFSRSQSMIFDFAKVTRVDSSGVALLLLWMQKARTHNKKITFINVTEQMQTIINVCGLEGIIEWKN